MPDREHPERPKELILLVEDSLTQALRMRLVLESNGFMVDVCSTGTMALAQAADKEPDLVLLDMHLPDMGGREVARKLKEDTYLSGIPVIFITEVFRDVADVVTGFNLGVDDYLIKPIDDGELIARIKASLRAKRTQRELGRLARVLMTVNQVGLQLAGILNLEWLLQSVARLIHENFAYPGVHVYLTEGEHLVLSAAEGPARNQEPGAPRRFALSDRSLAARSITEGQLLAIERLTEEYGLHPLTPEWQSALAVPFQSAGHFSGVLEVTSPDGLAFSELDQMALQTLAALVGIAVQNARLYKQMEDLARVDALTGLLNRRAILAELADECSRAKRYQRDLSVIVTDADGFKQINDKYGHATGDLALQALARLFRRNLREVDHAGRLGGDEFLLLLPETSVERARVVADRIISECSRLDLTLQDGTVVPVRISLGLVGYSGTQAGAPDELMRLADEAMYQAKASGGSCFVTPPSGGRR